MFPENPVAYLRENIKKNSFAEFSFPISREEFSKTADCFFEFLSLPYEAKQKFLLYIDHEDPESMVGYLKRQHKNGDYDEKEYFHYNRYAEAEFSKLADEIGPKASEFFKRARYVYGSAELVMGRIIKALDGEYPGLYDRFFPTNAFPHFYLRFLKYNTMGKGNFLAGAHYDQGACTLALAESAPGLRIGLNEATLKEVKQKEGTVIFMPGLQLRLLTSEEFTPAWHDVVQKSDDAFSEDAARWSIVFFADPIKKEKTTWEDRHKPHY